MKSSLARRWAAYQRLPASTTPVLLIILAVLVGNIMYLSGLSSTDPIAWTANISHYLCRVACVHPAIDPNLGYLTQPLGHLAATDLLHGHLPWWNYFEGLGQPLAGEMQSAALFPLTILFAFSNGLLWFHVSLELIAGLSTYFLARRLSIPIFIATGVGIVFALNGTMAWLGNAVLNPVAFLPMLLLGLEMIFDDAQSKTRKGWYVAAIAVALSIYAGFPEVAYLDGLFAGGWAVVRLFMMPRESRRVAAGRVAVAALTGVVLALPILVAFYDFYKVAFVGSHVASLLGQSKLLGHAASMLMDPYIYGNIFTNQAAYPFWGGIGGYFGASVVALGLLGLFGSRLRPLRIYLAAWTLVALLGVFNVFHVRVLWNLLPLVNTMAFSRYAFASCEISIAILAALGIMDLAENARAKQLFLITTPVALLLLLWGTIEAASTNHGVVLSAKTRIIFIGLDSIPFLAIGALLILAPLAKHRMVPLLVTGVLVIESLLLFFVPTAEAPKQITIDQGPISFLRANQGQGRFLDFGVLNPNWGTQFRLNSLSAIDLPFPQTFANLLSTKLFPALTPLNQFVIHAGLSGIIAQENALQTNFAAFQAASVKYLLLPQRIDLLPGLTQLGVKKVFEDQIAAIYEMPNPRPFFSTTAPSCSVRSSAVDTATVTCPSGGATLIRTELPMAGWHATVNGRTTTINTVEDAYQSVEVPGGTSVVKFTFLPPHESLAILASILAALFLVGSFVLERLVRPRRGARGARRAR